MPERDSSNMEKKVSNFFTKTFKNLLALICIIIIIVSLLTGFIFHIYKDDTADGHRDYKKRLEELDNKKELENMTKEFENN